ncbi:hypothetical protein BCR33DRAFT_723195 [Rhizoclosmatium globosum]|uniref:PH domain-containing protein n=1 Tax=Rhizoclosmatium globosum TaxID=329046 RepID=A0A1Y2BFD0_9FUNG|nr:hypothetical protein BCR33DRAFT_723195 [Rhizoclosmatium globosum]|eukprot:ORY33187.1 hypothetical protein BCR33DRAFT_723195 [Rhizoclosmatium globosum]
MTTIETGSVRAPPRPRTTPTSSSLSSPSPKLPHEEVHSLQASATKLDSLMHSLSDFGIDDDLDDTDQVSAGPVPGPRVAVQSIQSASDNSKASMRSSVETALALTLNSLMASNSTMSGFLYKLNSHSDAQEWKMRFFVLTMDANLYLFKGNSNPIAQPVTFLPIDACTPHREVSANGTQQWIMKASGDGLTPEGDIVTRTWHIRFPDEDTLLAWVHAIHAVINVPLVTSGVTSASSSMMRNNNNVNTNVNNNNRLSGGRTSVMSSASGGSGSSLYPSRKDSQSQRHDVPRHDVPRYDIQRTDSQRNDNQRYDRHDSQSTLHESQQDRYERQRMASERYRMDHKGMPSPQIKHVDLGGMGIRSPENGGGGGGGGLANLLKQKEEAAQKEAALKAAKLKAAMGL